MIFNIKIHEIYTNLMDFAKITEGVIFFRDLTMKC
jgi:hypothetical protein